MNCLDLYFCYLYKFFFLLMKNLLLHHFHKYILFFSELENNENDDDMDLFIKSLALSLRATDCKKIESADIQHGIDQVFTFCAESEQLPSKFEKYKVINFGTIQDICKYKESKVKFLHAIQYSLN